MHILLIFLDGVGLGRDDAENNPFSAADLPVLHALTNGRRWLQDVGIQRTERSLFIPTDAGMGVPGRPQSGTGQAAIVTGRNIPALIGEHYGPKPNQATREQVSAGTFFSELVAAGRTASLLEAYPPRWHYGINSGKSLPSSYQQAVRDAGLPFFGETDLRAGDAISGDWTGEAWRTHLGYPDMPVISPQVAGERLVALSRRYDFAFFSHWITDVTGHRGTLQEGITLLRRFDGVMEGVLSKWDDDEGLVIVTSDHGNIEDLSHRRHTDNRVPTMIIGRKREIFADLGDLSGIVPRMRRLLLDAP